MYSTIASISYHRGENSFNSIYEQWIVFALCLLICYELFHVFLHILKGECVFCIEDIESAVSLHHHIKEMPYRSFFPSRLLCSIEARVFLSFFLSTEL